jgi:hypothetical protein
MSADIDVEAERNTESRGFKPGAVAGGVILLVVGATLLIDGTGAVATPLRQLIGPLVLIALGALIAVEKGGIAYGCRRRDEQGRRPGRRTVADGRRHLDAHLAAPPVGIRFP